MAFDTTIETYNTYAATLTEMTNAEFVADAYAKLLGLEGDFVNAAARIDYWVAKLEAGTLTKETFAAAFIEEASTTQGELLTDEDFAYNQGIMAAIEAADASNITVTAIDAAIDGAGLTAPVSPEQVAALDSAITGLATANTAKSDFIAAGADIESVNEADADDADDVEEADFATALTNSIQSVDDALEALGTTADGDFIAAGDNAKTGQIADGRADAADAVDDAQDELTAFNADVAGVKENGNLLALLNDSAATTDASDAADAAEDAADAELAGQVAEFESLYAAEAALVVNADGTIDGATTAGIIVLDGDDLVVADGMADMFPNADLDALLAATIAVESAQAAAIAAQAAEDDADAALAALTLTADEAATFDAGYGYDNTTTGDVIEADLAGLEGVLEAAQGLSDDLEDAVSNWEAMLGLTADLDGLNDAVTAAEEAIEDSVEDGGLGLNIVDFDGSAATAGNDILIYDNDADETIANFGSAGQDKIFFGTEFTLVALGDDDITDDVGSASAMEIFWEEDGADLVLYVENAAFGGNASGTDDVVEITLTGVSAEDITFADGYMTAGDLA